MRPDNKMIVQEPQERHFPNEDALLANRCRQCQQAAGAARDCAQDLRTIATASKQKCSAY
jgi:hypothetical protein